MFEEKGSSYVWLAGEFLACLVPASCESCYEKNDDGAESKQSGVENLLPITESM